MWTVNDVFLTTCYSFAYATSSVKLITKGNISAGHFKKLPRFNKSNDIKM